MAAKSELEIDLTKLLTKEQKRELGELVFEKFKKEIESTPLDLSKLGKRFEKVLVDGFEYGVENEYLSENINWKAIGKAISLKLVGGLR